eukprot:3170901-Lingulodinium_polyedra.AAC.1
MANASSSASSSRGGFSCGNNLAIQRFAICDSNLACDSAICDSLFTSRDVERDLNCDLGGD